MEPPFTRAEFFEVFAAYNEAVWPAQWALVALAVVAVALSFGRSGGRDQAVALLLGALWIWMGIVYHWVHFSRINAAAWLFGALFVLQGALLAAVAFGSETLELEPRLDLYGVAGGTLIAYALMAYPLLGAALGHTYPEAPTFGLPCPTTILTFGILLWARPRVPSWLLAVPMAWSVVGASAAWLFGVYQDLALPIAGVLGGGMILWRNHVRGVPLRRAAAADSFG